MASRLGCAILDADCLGEVFGREESEAGEEFLHWILDGRVHLISGGQLHQELRRSNQFRQWAAAGPPNLRIYRRKVLEADITQIAQHGAAASNDTHILSLARVSGARLLYSRDRRLRRDFKNPGIISEPGGELYNQGAKDVLTNRHRALLRNARPCA